MSYAPVLTHVKNSVAAIFHRGEVEDPPESSTSSARSRVCKVPPSPCDEFLVRLRDIVRRTGVPVQAGRINFIGLDQAKKRLGDRWEQVSNRAHLIARSTIEHCLRPGDIYVMHGDKYIIAFAEIDAVQARVRCQLIARIVEQALFGEEGDGVLSVATAVASLDGDVVLEQVPSLDTMLAWQTEEPSPPPPIPPTRLAPSPVIEPQFRLSWRPTWDARHGVLGIYRAVLRDRYGDYLPPPDQAELQFDHDQRLRDLAVETLEQRLRADVPQLINLPIHFETVASFGKRRCFLDGLSRILSQPGRKFLMLSLVDVPAGIPSSRMQEISTALRGHCSALSVRFPIDTNDFRAARASGVNWVGCELSSSAEGGRAQFVRIQAFGRAADQAGIPHRFIGGLNSLSLAVAALDAGFTHLNGPVIAPVVDVIGGVRSFELKDLYQPLLSKSVRSCPVGEDRMPVWAGM